MIYTATNAAEISDFITAEIMINGASPAFLSNDKVTGEFVEIDAATLMQRVRNAETDKLTVSRSVDAEGRTVFQIHNGASVYGRYTAA